jgi:hypothetical protein
MPQTFLNSDHKNILELAQKWRTGTIDGTEFELLNAWYYALESMPLGCPDENTVEKVELWLHRQFFKFSPNKNDDGLLPPWDSLKRK